MLRENDMRAEMRDNYIFLFCLKFQQTTHVSCLLTRGELVKFCDIGYYKVKEGGSPWTVSTPSPCTMLTKSSFSRQIPFFKMAISGGFFSVFQKIPFFFHNFSSPFRFFSIFNSTFPFFSVLNKKNYFIQCLGFENDRRAINRSP